MQIVARAAKAFFAAAIAGIGALQVALVGGESFSDLTAAQWVTIAAAVVVAFGGVYGIANKPPDETKTAATRLRT